MRWKEVPEFKMLVCTCTWVGQCMYSQGVTCTMHALILTLTPLPLPHPIPQAMAADPEHYSKLVASVAPRVIDMDSVKAGLLCQLFGGVSKSTAAALGGHTTSRYAGGPG